jgi:hypothetical protein
MLKQHSKLMKGPAGIVYPRGHLQNSVDFLQNCSKDGDNVVDLGQRMLFRKWNLDVQFGKHKGKKAGCRGHLRPRATLFDWV